MKSLHEDIKDVLSEYVRGRLSADMNERVAAHLRDCEDCRKESAFLSEIIDSPVPDPGDVFWKALPGRVAMTVGEGRKTHMPSLRSLISSWLRPLPAAAAATALVLLTLSFLSVREKGGHEHDPSFRDPLSVALLDYGNLEESDIPAISDQSVQEAIVYYDTPNRERSYYWEISSLSSKEMESLYEALKNKQKSGG